MHAMSFSLIRIWNRILTKRFLSQLSMPFQTFLQSFFRQKCYAPLKGLYDLVMFHEIWKILPNDSCHIVKSIASDYKRNFYYFIRNLNNSSKIVTLIYFKRVLRGAGQETDLPSVVPLLKEGRTPTLGQSQARSQEQSQARSQGLLDFH